MRATTVDSRNHLDFFIAQLLGVRKTLPCKAENAYRNETSLQQTPSRRAHYVTERKFVGVVQSRLFRGSTSPGHDERPGNGEGAQSCWNGPSGLPGLGRSGLPVTVKSRARPMLSNDPNPTRPDFRVVSVAVISGVFARST